MGMGAILILPFSLVSFLAFVLITGYFTYHRLRYENTVQLTNIILLAIFPLISLVRLGSASPKATLFFSVLYYPIVLAPYALLTLAIAVSRKIKKKSVS